MMVSDAMKTMVISAEGPNWLDLPGEILDQIGRRLKLTDFIRFQAVCKLWRRALFPSRSRQSIPWLMLPHCRDSIITDGAAAAGVGCKGTDSCRCFYDLEDQMFRHIELPQTVDKTCRGSAFGWVFMLEKLPSMVLLNPFSKDRIDLPPITAFPDVLGFRPELARREYLYVGQDGLRVAYGKKNMERRFIVRVALSAEPTSKDCIVMVIRALDVRALAFCRPNRDEKWTLIPPPDPTKVLIEDVAFWRDRFYVFAYTGEVYVCDLSLAGCPKLSLFLDEPSPRTRNIFESATNFYLLTSPADDELMVVIRHVSDPEDGLVTVNMHHERFLRNEDGVGSSDDEGTDDDDDEQTSDDDDDDDDDDDSPAFLPGNDGAHGKVDLYGIDSESDDDDDDDADVDEIQVLTDEFRVFKATEGRKGWDEVEGIGDFALFLGLNKPVWVSTGDRPELAPNSIYFTDNVADTHRPRKLAGADMGVYDLATHTISPFYSTASVHKNPSFIFPLPVWISPSNY